MRTLLWICDCSEVGKAALAKSRFVYTYYTQTVMVSKDERFLLEPAVLLCFTHVESSPLTGTSEQIQGLSLVEFIFFVNFKISRIDTSWTLSQLFLLFKEISSNILW